MLSEICREIRNWFEVDKHIGVISINGGQLAEGYGLQNGQYFRIVGSVFNDGIYQYPATDLHDEEFDGAVWSLAIPQEVISLSSEIDAWQAKYCGIDSAAMSPFNSESFGGYSYTKSAGAQSNSGASPSTWQSAFAKRLNAWRKI
jgi:hypothetical protein